MFNFSAGRARLIPAGGGTPLELGVVQSADVEFKVDLKELRGAYRYPIAVADGKGTCSGKVSFAQLWPATLAGITGATVGTGAPEGVIAESATIAAVTPFDVTLANAATMVPGSEIVTVIDATGSPVFYSRGAVGAIASSSVAGQANGVYSIANGVLTFIAADAGLKVQVTYLYTPVAGINNTKLSLQQVGMNSAPTFQLTLLGTGAKNIYNNQAQQFIVQLNACLAPSLKLNLKLDDFTMADLDYQAFTDVNGILGEIFLINPAG